MFINPKLAIQEGWITHPNCRSYEHWEQNKFVSPNAIDFTLDKLWQIRTTNNFIISEEGKMMRGVDWVEPILDPSSGLSFWSMIPSNVYDGLSNVYVELPDGVAAILVTRSSFTRNGLFITSGLYDSGFKGHIGFVIHSNAMQRAKVAMGTRIGQIIFVESENALQYAGGYNHESGTAAPHQE